MIWKFTTIRDYSYQLISSEAVVPLPEYHAADIPQIVAAAAAAAAADRESFEKKYLRQTFSGDVIFSAIEGGGNAAFAINTRNSSAPSITISCSMNRFVFTNHKETLMAWKDGDSVHIRGSIGPATDAHTVALTDGCAIEKSYLDTVRK